MIMNHVYIMMKEALFNCTPMSVPGKKLGAGIYIKFGRVQGVHQLEAEQEEWDFSPK